MCKDRPQNPTPSTGYVARMTSTVIRSALSLILLCLASCTTPTTTGQPNSHMQLSTGTFVSRFKWFNYPDTQPLPLLRLQFDTNGTYLAEDLGPPEYTSIVEGTRIYMSRSTPQAQRGRWRIDEKTGSLLLAREDDVGFRWGLHNLRMDATNSTRIAWGSDYLERIGD